jgi:hypothetical protein
MSYPSLWTGLRMPFSQFWPLYLDAHREPATRAAHYIATFFGAAATAVALALGLGWIAFAGIGLAVCMAVGAHWLIERNQPLILVNPFYGACADLRMCWLALTGGLATEYARLGLGSPEPRVRGTPAE